MNLSVIKTGAGIKRILPWALLCAAFIILLPSLPVLADGPEVYVTDIPSTVSPWEEFMEVGRMSRDRFNLKPSYYIMGDSRTDTKVQIGFIYQIVRTFDLYIAYNQLILWDLNTYSAPISDINCNPNFYYKFRLDTGVLKSVDLGIWEHTSNLMGGNKSRGWDRSYIQVNTFYEYRWFGLAASMKLFTIYRLDEYSADLDRYMGFWELKLALVAAFDWYIDKIELTLRLFAGGKYSVWFTRGGQEVGFTLRFRGFDPHLYAQYYHGRVESLLDYKKEVTSLRFGVLFYL